MRETVLTITGLIICLHLIDRLLLVPPNRPLYDLGSLLKSNQI